MIVTKDLQSLETAIDRLSDAKTPKRNDLSSVSNESSTSWDLNTPFEAAREKASSGWREKADELWKHVQALALKVDAGVSERFDVSGEAVDVGRYLSNEPECMFALQVSPLASVSILLNIGASSSANAEYLYNRGIAIAAVIHALQASGRGVSLKVCESLSGYSDGVHITEITLQEFGEYINPGRLAFWVAHPAALRRCFFRYNEQQNRRVRERFGFYEGAGYGRPIDLPAENIPEGVVYFPSIETSDLHASYATPQKALATVVKEFKSKGVPIEISTRG